jgi:hypothetical protein
MSHFPDLADFFWGQPFVGAKLEHEKGVLLEFAMIQEGVPFKLAHFCFLPYQHSKAFWRANIETLKTGKGRVYFSNGSVFGQQIATWFEACAKKGAISVRMSFWPPEEEDSGTRGLNVGDIVISRLPLQPFLKPLINALEYICKNASDEENPDSSEE